MAHRAMQQTNTLLGLRFQCESESRCRGRLEETQIHPLCTFTIPAIRPGGSTVEPTEAQRKAREWLPEAMLFPAVDANAPVDVGGEADSVEEMTDEN
jgi:hypothetical protein